MRVLLTLVFVLVAFAIVAKVAPDYIPEFLTPRAGNSQVPAEKIAEAETGKSAAPHKPAVKKVEKIEASESSVAVAALTETKIPEKTNVATDVQSPRRARPVFSVSSEKAPLYVTNRSSASVVDVLTNGEVVEPQYVLDSGGQEWTFVNVADKKISGFLRSEDLTKVQPAADQTSR